MFPKAVSVDARAHALDDAPLESVGAVVRGHYCRLANLATDPCNDFRIDDRTMIDLDGRLEALIHSHVFVDGEFDPRFHPMTFGPSERDMVSQRATGVPWGIVTVYNGKAVGPAIWGDGVRSELVGRTYISGIQDCYALVRDWFFMQRAIDLPDVPRGWGWWSRAGAVSPFEALYGEFGFESIDFEEAAAGDVLLCRLRSEVVNHAAIYTGEDTVLHHLAGRLSGPSTVGALRKLGEIRHVCRYHSNT